MVHLDGLTGIANRRRFNEALSREWRRAGRESSPLALILGDIDFFKKYNDFYGHLAGDACLKDVAKAVARALLRPADLAARYGGEEFAFLLPDTEIAGAMEVAKRLQAEVWDLDLEHSHSSVANRVTLSLGVAVMTPGEGQSSATLVEAADRMLYRAKESGRNRIVSEADELAGTENTCG